MNKVFLISFILNLFSLNFSLASVYSLTSASVNKFDSTLIYSSYRWDKVKNLSNELQDILNLKSRDKKLRVLKARFVFYIKGEFLLFDEDFYSKKKTLDDLSGMNHQRIGINRFMAEDSSMTLKVSAQIDLNFNMDYGQYQSVFDYDTTDVETNLVHQKAREYSKFLHSSDIITHVSQEGQYVRVIIDSFAVLKRKGSSRLFSYGIKKIIVKKMKDQIVKVPSVYLQFMNY